ncbi:MAG: hypothetical protein K2X38_19800 [Gemmataceae bacterium]|nr:hypothetical protein [Gemmataceae bacterium]
MAASDIRNLALALVLAFGGTSAFAQDAVPVPGTKQVLTQDQMFAYLKGLDPNAKRLPDSNPPAFAFTFRRSEVAIPMTASLYESNIWLNCEVAVVEDAEKLPADLLLKILRAHTPIGPTFFRLDRVGNKDIFRLSHRIDRPLGADRLAAAIQEMSGDVATTAPIWSKLASKDGKK